MVSQKASAITLKKPGKESLTESSGHYSLPPVHGELLNSGNQVVFTFLFLVLA